MKKFATSKNYLRGLAITMVASMSLMMTACGGGQSASKNITLYGTEEEYGKVTLGQYKGIAAEKKVYEITDAAIDSEIEYMLYDYVEYKSVDRGAKEEDSLSLTMKASSNGETLYDSSAEESGVYETQIGYEDFGPEFDEQLTGAKKGDQLSFSIDYDEEFSVEDFAGKKVDFDVTVSDVTEEVSPELTEAFIKDQLGYDNEEALRKSISDDLSAQYQENSNYTLYFDLIEKVVATSQIESYSDDLYNSCYAATEQNYMSYMEMLGCETLDEVYTAFGITADDIKQEAIDQVNHEVVVNAIAAAEKFEISQEDYDKKIDEFVETYEYEDAKALKEDVSEADLKYMIMEDMVYKFLEENATLTEVSVDPAEEEAADFEEEDGEDDDILIEDADIEEVDFEDDVMEEDADEIQSEDDLEDADEVDADEEETLEDDGDVAEDDTDTDAEDDESDVAEDDSEEDSTEE